jgi:hypothetical protein
MRKIGIAAVLVLVLAAVLVLALSGCESPAAQREQARADRIRAEAESYERQRAADSAAAAERSAVRLAERDAAHLRIMELLPIVIVLVGAVGLAGLAGLIVYDGRAQRQTDPALLFYLEQQRREQAALWRAVAQLDRRAALGPGDQGGAIWTESERGS